MNKNSLKIIFLLYLFSVENSMAQIKFLSGLEGPSPNVLIQGEGCVSEYLENDSIGPLAIIKPSEGARFLKLSYSDTNFYNDCSIRLGWKFSPGIYNAFRINKAVLLSVEGIKFPAITEGVSFFVNGTIKGGVELPSIFILNDTANNWKQGGFEFNFDLFITPNSIIDSVELVYRFNRFNEKTPFIFYLDDVQLELYRIAGVDQVHSVQVQVYPNPVHNFVHIRTLDVWNSGSIYDLQGRLHVHFSPDDIISGHGLNLSGLQPGLYVMQLSMLNGTKAFARVLKH